MDPGQLEQILTTVLEKQNEALRKIIMDKPGLPEISSNILSRLPTFSYDPDNAVTFESWLTRYEIVLKSDGRDLDEATRARLIVQRLDAQAFERFSSHILPKRAEDLSYKELVNTLKELFGHNLSLVSRRYRYLRVQCNHDNDGTFEDYTGDVNRLHEMAEMSSVTPDELKT